MRHSETIPQQQHLHAHAGSKSTLTKIVQGTLYVSGALAVALGLIVWPGKVHEIGGIHGLAGWLTIVSLLTLSGIAARAHVPRGTVWLAVGWGLVTTLGAFAQYQLRPGSWITVLHVATGLGTVAWGQHLVTRMRQAEAAPITPGAAIGSELAMKDAAAEFLAKKRIAVTGVSRNPATQHGSNIVYRRLRERGYEVFAINPNTAEVEGDRCYPDLKSIPGGADAVVIATRPDRAMATMSECADLGIQHVWMHRSIGIGSVSEEAAAWGRQRGMRVIGGGCPLMFNPAADPAHRFMRSVFTLTGKVPRRV